MALADSSLAERMSSVEREDDSRRGRRRLDHLDGLRGIAALIVVFHHFALAFLMNQNGVITNVFAKTPADLLINGVDSVLIFFVLSGFVLSQSVGHLFGQDLPLLLSTRYFRLTLPMVLSLIWAWILMSAFSRSRMEVSSLCPIGWFDQMFSLDMPPLFDSVKTGFYAVYRDGSSSLNPVVWTMQRELVGSICIYLIYCLLQGRWRWLGLAVMTATALVNPFYPLFAVGAIFRELWIRNKLTYRFYSWPILGTGLFLAFLSGRVSGHETNQLLRAVLDHQRIVGAPAAAMIVFSVLTIPVIQKMLRSMIPQFLGRISFALYLVHAPLLGSLMAGFDLNLSLPLYPKLILMLVIFVSLAMGTALLMTILIDEPLVRLLRKIKKTQMKLPGLPKALVLVSSHS